LKSIRKHTAVKGSYSESPDIFASIEYSKKNVENDLRFRLKKMEENNLHLKKVIEQGKQKIDEIITKNNKFVSILAHDLRSPFNSIMGFLELIKRDMDTFDKEKFENYINIAYNSANNMLNLLNNLLVWTLSQSGEKNYNPVKIDLDELLFDEIHNHMPLAKQKQINLNHSLASDLTVRADLQMVRTILRNLITNAIKYTNPGGEITISAIENDKHIEIAIEDNGIGISFEAQKELFKIDSFHSTIGTNNEKGTGLGLLLCKELVEINGGNILIESEPGKGCELKFTLPQFINDSNNQES
jgi:signal transduction histidine kinase